MYYTIIALLPQNLVTALTPYRQKFDPQANIIPPHITVVRPFEFADPLAELYEHLDEIGDTHAPIKVSLVGWDVCAQTNYQLQLPLVAGQLEFTTLHHNLLAGPLSQLAEADKAYRPHITLGRFVKKSELEQAKKFLSGFEPQFAFSVTHLELLYRHKLTHRWKPKKRFSLEATLLSPPRKKRIKDAVKG